MLVVESESSESNERIVNYLGSLLDSGDKKWCVATQELKEKPSAIKSDEVMNEILSRYIVLHPSVDVSVELRHEATSVKNQKLQIWSVCPTANLSSLTPMFKSPALQQNKHLHTMVQKQFGVSTAHFLLHGDYL